MLSTLLKPWLLKECTFTCDFSAIPSLKPRFCAGVLLIATRGAWMNADLRMAETVSHLMARWNGGFRHHGRT